MTISRSPKILVARVVACAALALAALATPVAAQDTTAAPAPARRPLMDDPDGVGRLALEAMAGLYRAGARPTRGLLMVRAQPGDPEPTVRFLRADVPDSVKAAVQPAVAGFLARNRGRPVNVSIRLAEETLAVLAGEWEWGPDQAPVLRNERQFQARIDQIANEAMGGVFSTWAPERGSEYSILISPAGTVLAVSVTESGLGGAQDQVVMEAAHDMRWEPAQLQGQPIPAWKPYRFTLRRP
ncbi:MAG TPA: hypothetical protein VFR81_10185 [Longimicrobium sp.]|nr:hypothetical protein [Longimicrobium sp.]